MSDGLYIGMAGATARAAQLESIADNLSNAQTPGFKAERPAFESFLPPSGATDKVYPAAVATRFDLSPGATVRTGEPLDVLPEGGAFFAVRTATGAVAFTRDGKLSVDAEGNLRSGQNFLLQPDGQTLTVPPGARPTIHPDGSLRLGEQRVGQLALASLSGNLARVGPSLLAPIEGGAALPVASAVRVGELEMANTTGLEAAVQLVSAQRHYETSMQAIQTYRRLDERANEVGRIR